MNFGGEDDAKHLAEFLKPTTVKNGNDIRYDGVKDDKENEIGYKGATENDGNVTGEVSKGMENDLHNDLKTPPNMSSPTKDSIAFDRIICLYNLGHEERR